MPRKQARYGLTREVADALATVRTAVEAGRLSVDPMASVVLADLEEAVRAYAKNSAIVRVRQINMGTPPKERERRKHLGETKRSGLNSTEWSIEEIQYLHELCRQSPVPTMHEMAMMINEKFGVARRDDGVWRQIHKLGLPHRAVGERGARPVSLAVSRVAARRAAEKRARMVA